MPSTDVSYSVAATLVRASRSTASALAFITLVAIIKLANVCRASWSVIGSRPAPCQALRARGREVPPRHLGPKTAKSAQFPADASRLPLYPPRIDLVRQLTSLWTQPLGSESEALLAFDETYADPVRINGIDVGLTELVARARMLQRAFSDLQIEPLDQIGSGDRFVLAFLQRGRHTGRFETPLGPIEPTTRTFEIRVIDILTISAGRISAIEVVPDNLSLMMQLGAVGLLE